MKNGEYARHWRKAVHKPKGVLGYPRSWLRSVVLSSFAMLAGKPEDRFLRLLFTHNVFDDQGKEFETILVKCKQMGTFVDTDTCIQMIQGERPIDQRYFHLSFDDGFKNIYTNAFPILRKHAIPALYFVPSALIGADWKRAYQFCKETTRYSGTIEMISWQELDHMAANGIEIGSHTRNHVNLSALSQNPADLKEEIQGSKLEIEKGLGRECRYISWPYGVRSAIDPTSLEHARKAGYKACFGGFRGTAVPGKTELFQIPRHYFETNWPLSHVMFFAKGDLERGFLTQRFSRSSLLF